MFALRLHKALPLQRVHASWIKLQRLQAPQFAAMHNNMGQCRDYGRWLIRYRIHLAKSFGALITPVNPFNNEWATAHCSRVSVCDFKHALSLPYRPHYAPADIDWRTLSAQTRCTLSENANIACDVPPIGSCGAASTHLPFPDDAQLTPGHQLEYRPS